MTRLKFEDIDEWTPSSISIVDVPAHPLCRFEVYEDDEEYVKKSIEINEGEFMEEQNPQIEEPMVQAPVSFFEKLLGRTVAKAVEEPEPQKEEEEKPEDDIIAKLEARIEKLEAKVAELEKEPEVEKSEEQSEEVTPGAVEKSEGEGEGEAEATENPTIDEEKVVAKSKSIDPDGISHSTTEETLLERTGRKSNGMTW